MKRRSLKTVIELVLILGLLHERHETKWVNRSQDNTEYWTPGMWLLDVNMPLGLVPVLRDTWA